MVLASTLSGPSKIEPVLWLHPKGDVLVAGQPAKARLTPGARTVRTPIGYGLDLDGKRGGLLLPDLTALGLTRSITVSTWIYLRSYVSDGPGAQVLFRGDDRSGVDPYTLVVHNDGTINFGIQGADGLGAHVTAEVPLKQWVHVTGSFNEGTGELRLWLDDNLVSTRYSNRRPFIELDGKASPGVGIGNVQNDQGPHNQPLNGILVDLRLYPTVLEPRETGFAVRSWSKNVP